MRLAAAELIEAGAGDRKVAKAVPGQPDSVNRWRHALAAGGRTKLASKEQGAPDARLPGLSTTLGGLPLVACDSPMLFYLSYFALKKSL